MHLTNRYETAVLEDEMAPVSVQISGRALWIGDDAYPLHNIARAGTVRGGPTKMTDQARAQVGCACVPLFFILLLPSGWAWHAHQYLLAIAPWAIVALPLVIWLVVRAVKKPRYSLIIETSGATFAALTSTNKNYLDRIAWEIMTAIGNPAAEY
jgi:hypothetical protein